MVECKPVTLDCAHFTGRICCLCFSCGKFTCPTPCTLYSYTSLCVCVYGLIIPSLPQLYIFLWTTTLRDPPVQRSKSESVFRDPVSNQTHMFPLTVATSPTLYLSLVAPAYKEQDRCEPPLVYLSNSFIYPQCLKCWERLWSTWRTDKNQTRLLHTRWSWSTMVAQTTHLRLVS